MTDILEQPDDFSDLDEETREFITRKTHEIHGLMRRTAEEIIIIGENLLMVQQRLPEMKFAAWLRAEFDFSRQSAYNFMRVANKLGGSCKTVLQLPAKVLYELASSSEAIVQQVETGQLSPTLDSIRAAKEAERQARADVERTQAQLRSLQRELEAQQTIIEHLSQDLEDTRQKSDEDVMPVIEIREVEKSVLPLEIKEQLATLEQQLNTVTQQRDTLSSQVAELQAQVLLHDETDHVRQIHLSWYRITNEFQRSVRTLLSQWPSPLDVLLFEADDWTRLSQTKELAKRLLEECGALTEAEERMVIDCDSVIVE